MRHRSRAATALSCTALVVGAALASAPSAMAGSATVTCGAPESLSFFLGPAETFTLNISGACTELNPADNVGTLTYGVNGTEAPLPLYVFTTVTPPVKVIYTQPACSEPQTLLDAVYFSDSSFTNNGVAAFDFIANPCSAPPDVLQQIGAPPNGDCAAVAPAPLNIGGSGPGGWGRSWAQWVNDGRGGAVCTRTLTYNNSVGHYTVAQ